MSPKLPLILLPPSEGKRPGGSGPCWDAAGMANDLAETQALVIAGLKRSMRKSAAERSKLLGVKGAALEAATEANLNVESTPTMPSIERYSGVLYEALELETMSTQAKRRLNRSVLIFSGLFGLVAPSDPIPDYKLKMGASLAGTGKLSTQWRPVLSEALATQVAKRLVWNLLPNEHDAAWENTTGVPQVSVRFLERRPDGSMVAVSHWNKFFKGALVRHLLEEPSTTPESLAEWRHPAGWRLDPKLETTSGDRRNVAFVRDSES